MSKHALAIIASVILILVVGLGFLANRNTSQAPTTSNPSTKELSTVVSPTLASTSTQTASPSATVTGEAMSAVKE
jgi:hypothetical protein